MPRVLTALAAASLVFCVLLSGGGAAVAAAEPADDDRRCLALAMYWEARGQGREAMIAVGAVVLNRVDHVEFPDTVCGVVFQGGETPPCQFSWWCDGKSDRPTEAEAWALARELAEEMLSNPPDDPTRGALFFHAARVAPSWRKAFVPTVKVGQHIFYRL